ncbi:MAG TPA: GNAT family N-acetyltransferase [Anaerolineae bacterium]|nr:GNAT family N-acetyltransferase [Anaerolineae bacterium]
MTVGRFEIRLMTEADADTVRHIDQSAFGDWMHRRGHGEPMPLRTRANVLSLWSRDPQGCFVAEVEGRAVGYVFSRTWGRVGWFGTLGVHPRFQGRSIGRALVHASVKYLDWRGCTTIGLGTMPEEPKNVGLYARCGFRPDHLTVILAWAAAPASRLPAYTLFSELPSQERDRLLQDALPRISGEARPGLDYSPEVRAAAVDGYGETLLLGDPGDPWGFAVVRTRPKWEDRPLGTFNVEAGVLAAGEEDRLGDLLALLADFAARRGVTRVLLPVNGYHWPALERLLALGCRAIHTRLRMILRQEPARPSSVDLSTWAA